MYSSLALLRSRLLGVRGKDEERFSLIWAKWAFNRVRYNQLTLSVQPSKSTWVKPAPWYATVRSLLAATDHSWICTTSKVCADGTVCHTHTHTHTLHFNTESKEESRASFVHAVKPRAERWSVWIKTSEGRARGHKAKCALLASRAESPFNTLTLWWEDHNRRKVNGINTITAKQKQKQTKKIVMFKQRCHKKKPQRFPKKT